MKELRTVSRLNFHHEKTFEFDTDPSPADLEVIEKFILSHAKKNSKITVSMTYQEREETDN